MNQQQEREPFPTNSDAFNLLYLCAAAYAAALYPFLRTGQGKRAYGFPTLGAMLIILLYAGRMHAPEMITYFYAWLGMLAFRVFTADRTQHTQYHGYPVIGRFIGDEMLSRAAEAVLVFIAGGLIEPHSHALGQFLMWGSLALAVKFGIERMLLIREDEAMHDAVAEMQDRSRRWKRQ